MKTILITSFHPLISRNILFSPVLDLLRASGVRVVVIGRTKKKEFFKKELPCVEVVSLERKLNAGDRFLRYLSLAGLPTDSIKLKQKTEMKGSGRFLSLWFRGWFARQSVRLIFKILIRGTRDFISILDEVHPDLIFSTDIQHPSDLGLFAAARRKKISIAGMVRSWDNPTSKGLIGVVPDILLVHNRLVKSEVEALHKILPSKIRVVGVPHYDEYDPMHAEKTESFYKKTGLDPKRPFLLFTPTGDRYISNNTVDRDILDMLDKILPSEYQILVRFPFTDTVAYLDNKKNYGRIFFDRPEMNFELHKNNELSKEGEKHLRLTLALCSLVVTGPSTICIDAAIFDKPIILIAFDGREKRKPLESIARYYMYDHWKPIHASEGASFAGSEQELATLIERYIRNPALHSGGRKKIVETELEYTDRKSSERVADVLKSML